MLERVVTHNDIDATTFFFGVCMCVWLDSVDGLCPEEGFIGVWVSRCMLSLVLGGFRAYLKVEDY